MAMIEFEDHRDDNQHALLQYLDSGAPPRPNWRATVVTALVLLRGTVVLGLLVVLR
jgi:hypothetical protein